MTTQSQNDANSAQINPKTERAVRSMVRAGVLAFSEALKDQEPNWEVVSRWERGKDRQFREITEQKVRPILYGELLRSLPSYETCVQQLESDPVIGKQLDSMVGTRQSAQRIEVYNILSSVIYAMLSEEGTFLFTEEKFDHKWGELVEFFSAEQIAYKQVAPLPGFVTADFPLHLNRELVLDRLTEDEVTRCCQVGVLHPQWQKPAMITAQDAVGIRRTLFLPKTIERGDDQHEQKDQPDDGGFGNRPFWKGSLIVDDVLLALRLFKPTTVRPLGYASWTDAPLVNAATLSQVLGGWQYMGNCELSAEEIPKFLKLWNLLEKNSEYFDFSLRRFNLAFDRRLSTDKIVDLVIAAESLFLGDLGVQGRGELSFRMALRAAKFLEHPNYGEQEIFEVMHRAYDARSAIVHGGLPKKTSLPDNPSANLSTFVKAIEEVVRLALQQALSRKEDEKNLGQDGYWNALLFSNSK